jgi:hypothetical protein
MSGGPDGPVSDAFVNELHDLADKDGFVANALLMALAEYARALPELDAEDAGDALGNCYRAVFDSQRLGAAVSLEAERDNPACAAAVEVHKQLIARALSDEAAVARTVDALRRLAGEPSEPEVVAAMRDSGWIRCRDEWYPQGRYFRLGGLEAAVSSDDDGQHQVTFTLAELDDDEGEYTEATQVLEDTAREILERVRAFVGEDLDVPAERFEIPGMDYLDPQYRRVGSWVLSIGLVHLESDEPVVLAAVMGYWRELEDPS